MRIGVVSEDISVLVMCSDVVSKLPGEPHEVISLRSDQPVDVEVCLWDIESNPHVPQGSAVNVFLVRRNALRSFLEENPDAAPNTLLKPLSPAALQVCLTHLISPADMGTLPSAKPASDRDALLECLLHSSLRLQEFEQDRTNFWARAAHDLRAPLTAASGYCGLLLDSQIGPLNAAQKELLTRVQHSLSKLNRMASAMFQLTAGKQLEGRYELKRADIAELIKRSVDEVRIFADEKRISLDIDFSPPACPLYVEPNQIEQVLVNLLENACKFTPRNGHIKVVAYSVGAAGKTGAGFRIDVWDSGPGIPPELLPNIFEEYVSHGSAADRSGGGLGLAICKMILQAHRGEIWTESGGNGTTFSFFLPFNEPMTVNEPVTAKNFSVPPVARWDEQGQILTKELRGER